MSKFYSINLKDYIFNSKFKNISFGDYVGQNDNYKISEDIFFQWIEKVFFANIKYESIWNKDYPSEDFVFNLESKLLPILGRMEYDWFRINDKKLKEIWLEISNRINNLENEIFEIIWEKFNLNSPKQLQVILFEKLKIPTTKKIKTWYSVDNEVLESIGEKYAIANMILEHRWLRKLLTTYVEWLIKNINPQTSKIHTTFNQTGTTTWRLSSENPNLQNIPSGNGYAEAIKSCFIPTDENYTIMVADYSQVELRILANLSQDPILLEAFKSWEDIHLKTAKFLFWENIQIDSEMRRRAKTVNFGVIYGISWFWLSKQIWTSPKEANEYIEKFYSTYSWVKNYYENILEKARNDSFVETYFWRRRYVNWLNDANKMMRWQAEREAINMPIQWTSADIIKLAMIQIAENIKKNNYKSRLILQVHDELVFEIHKDELFLQDTFKEIMENIIPFEAKLLVETWIWNNWKEAK